MSALKTIEDLLRNRHTGWWERLCEIIPVLRALVDTPQPPEFHGEGDVATHTRLAIEACPSDCDPDLLWVALLHDIGKPATTKPGSDGRLTAYGHAKLGAEMAEEVLSRLEMPQNRREKITWAIRHHNFPHSWQLNNAEDITRRQLRYLKDPKFPLLLEFLRLDALASCGNPTRMESFHFYHRLWEKVSGPS